MGYTQGESSPQGSCKYVWRVADDRWTLTDHNGPNGTTGTPVSGYTCPGISIEPPDLPTGTSDGEVLWIYSVKES